MRIACSRIETQINLEPDRPVVLNVESPREYYRLVDQLIAAFNGEESDFSFWKDDLQLRSDKSGEIITDLFSFSLTDKKIISLLYKSLQRNFMEGDLLLRFGEMSAGIEKFLEELCSTENFMLEYSPIDLEALLKICSVRPIEAYDSLLEKIVCYINLLDQLKNIDFFIFVGLKKVLTDEDLKMLYRHCRLQKIALLLIEGKNVRPILAEEKAITITEDLCEYVENFRI